MTARTLTNTGSLAAKLTVNGKIYSGGALTNTPELAKGIGWKDDAATQQVTIAHLLRRR